MLRLKSEAMIPLAEFTEDDELSKLKAGSN